MFDNTVTYVVKYGKLYRCSPYIFHIKRLDMKKSNWFEILANNAFHFKLFQYFKILFIKCVRE